MEPKLKQRVTHEHGGVVGGSVIGTMWWFFLGGGRSIFPRNGDIQIFDEEKKRSSRRDFEPQRGEVIRALFNYLAGQSRWCVQLWVSYAVCTRWCVQLRLWVTKVIGVA